MELFLVYASSQDSAEALCEFLWLDAIARLLSLQGFFRFFVGYGPGLSPNQIEAQARGISWLRSAAGKCLPFYGRPDEEVHDEAFR